MTQCSDMLNESPVTQITLQGSWHLSGALLVPAIAGFGRHSWEVNKLTAINNAIGTKLWQVQLCRYIYLASSVGVGVVLVWVA